MNGAEILIESLIRQSVDVIFGIPGSQLREIYAALYKNRNQIRHITARHEGGASLMAVGYARSSGKVGVCLTIPGPGASNAYTGMLEAYTACDPLLLITAQSESRYNGKDPSKMQHGFDQLSAFSPVTKYKKRVEAIEEIPGAVNEVFDILRSGRPRPVLLEITRDALVNKKDLRISIKAANPIESKMIDEQVEQAIDLIRRSERPFILAGRGVYHSCASNELLEFAKILQAPVATTAMGKGVIPENDVLALGHFKSHWARETMLHSDLVIAIGTRFIQTDTDNWQLKILQPLIHIEADPNEIDKEYTSEVGIAGDPKLILRQLIKILKNHKHKSTWTSIYKSNNKTKKSHKKSKYLQKLREVMASDAILSVDVNWLSYSAGTDFEVYEPNTFLYSPISMTMGFALPAAIGAKIAYPDREVVAFCGDGGFMLSSPEFATVAKYNLSVVTIVVNDNTYGTIKDVQLNYFGKTIGVNLYNPDFLKYAEAFGAHSFRVSDFNKFKPTLEKALALDKPVLIELLPKRSLKGTIYSSMKNVGRYLKHIS